MRVSSAAICTLAALAACHSTQQAALALSTPQQRTPSNDVVVDVSTDSARPVRNVAAPEKVVAQQFSLPPSNNPQYYQDYQEATVVPTSTDADASAQELPNVSKPLSPTPTLSQAQRQPTQRPITPAPKPRSPQPAPQPPNRPPAPPTNRDDLVVTVADVQVVGATPELEQVVEGVVKTRAGGEASQNLLQQDVEAILNTGLFANARVSTQETRNGLNVTYQVQPIVVRSIQLSGAKALTLEDALVSFQPQFGSPISPTALRESVQQVNKWYTDNGYSLARVVSIQPQPNGTLVVNVAEGAVGDVKFRFVDDKGKATDDKGNPIVGRTKEDFLRQEVKLQPGQIFREDVAREDLRQLFRSGLFNNVNVALEGDANRVDVVYELSEAPARSVNFGGGYSNDRGLSGNINYRDRNFGGVNDSLGVNVDVSTRGDLQFDGKFASPYRASNPDRFGYSASVFRRRGLSDTFDDEIKLPNGDRAREGKFGGSVALQRPIGEWDAALGLNYKRTSIRDQDGKVTPFDAQGNQLSFSGSGIDDLTTLSFAATRDKRNNFVNPTDGSILTLSTEQSIPIGEGNISMNRLRANYSQYNPVGLLGNEKEKDVFAVNLQGGTVIGDLPPYETFNLGGANSVRGYGYGDVASGRSYVLASAEYRFPLFNPVGGVLFADFGSDLGSGDTVLGQPGVVRGKPGTGFGYGAGVRINSPLGLIRADYGFNDQGESRFEFGFGQRF